MNKLKEWLSDRKRTYASGLKLFQEYGTEKQKAKYLQYFESAKSPRVLDSSFTMLINVLSRTEQLLILSGNTPRVAPEKTEPANISVTAKVDFSKIPADKLSAEAKDAYECVKNIRPKQAALHARLKDGSLSNKEKIAAANELIELEKTRVSAWKVIEAHFAGESVELTDDTPADTCALIQKGHDAAKRMKQLSQNISTAKNSVQTVKSESAKKKAKERLANYENELKELIAEYSI